MNELIKIKEMTEKYNISARTLRYYEDIGLISSIRNDDYAYRLYDESAAKRLEQVLILRRLNIGIKDIKRVFSVPGSEVVLEILDNKIADIDDEVALLHELKEIIIEFIQHIKDVDFTNDGDIKMLYDKAKDIETQLVNIDYNGNPSTVNRFLEITEKLERKPEIVNRKPYFYLIFDLGSKKAVIEACELYCEAFGAEKISVDTIPDMPEWIGINIKILDLGIFMQSNPKPVGGNSCCCIRFLTEEHLRKAYNALIKEGTDYSLHTDWDWTLLAATVRDKFNNGWLLSVL